MPGLVVLLLGSGRIGLGIALVKAEMISIEDASESVSLSLPVDISVSSELELESLEAEPEPEPEPGREPDDEGKDGRLSMSISEASFAELRVSYTPRPSFCSGTERFRMNYEQHRTHHLYIRLAVSHTLNINALRILTRLKF